MAFDNEAAKQALIELLRGSRRAVLLVGAGSSIPVGYPSWPQILEELRQGVVPELGPFSDSDLLQNAELIKRRLKSFPDHIDRLRQYHQLLYSRFGRRTPSHALFHRTLVKLPFCGIVTTNYDCVIEAAANYVHITADKDLQFETIDLCDNSANPAFQFLRGLGGHDVFPAVLHAHGVWRNPEQIILTRGDYEMRYGIPQTDAIQEGPLSAPSTRPLDTLHRKVIWSLLTMHPIVFVGFSVEDPAFQLMLDFVHEDFELAPNPPAHFAILGSRHEEDQDKNANRLRKYSVMPVFYPVVSDAAGQPDHSALSSLIEELGDSTGVVATPALDSLTRRLMER